MYEQIVKRDGTTVPFNAEKIVQAIAAAGKETGEFGEARARRLAMKVLAMMKQVFNGSVPTVEGVQDVVENVLMESTFRDTAKAYILYRDKRASLRNLDKGLDLVDEYVGQEDWRLRENASMSFSLQGLNNHLSGAISAKYWLERVYNATIRAAHDNAELHIHDLSILAPYCVGWDLYDLLKVGFKGVENKTQAGPPKHFSAALGQVFNFLYTLQGEAAGAQAFSSFDTLLAPFVRYDKMDYKDVKQKMQEFMFNMNMPTRVGFQQPFTNLTFDLVPSPVYRNEPALIGGEPWGDYTYGDFQPEMDLINRAFAEVMLAGDASGRVFTFPIPTYNVTDDMDWDNPVLEPICRMAGKFGIPYFANFVGSDMKPEDARSMCCRLKLDLKELDRRGGGLFGSNPLTGSLGVVTINLPRIAVKAANQSEFRKELRRLIALAADSLTMKRKAVEALTEKGLYPYSRFFLRSIKERTGQYWARHFLTIGIIGMHEACLNLLGQGIDTEQGLEFATHIMEVMRLELSDLQEKTGFMFNLEATPAEGVTYRLAKKDRAEFGDRLVMAYPESSAPFYTNSTHLPVGATSDLFKALAHQESLQSLYTGGTVFHAFLGESVDDPEAVKSLIKKIAHGFKLPYFSLTPTFSVCAKDGYLRGEVPICPSCGSETDVYSRVVGYYRPVSRWNDGKQAEYVKRLTYLG